MHVFERGLECENRSTCGRGALQCGQLAPRVVEAKVPYRGVGLQRSRKAIQISEFLRIPLRPSLDLKNFDLELPEHLGNGQQGGQGAGPLQARMSKFEVR